MEPQQKPVQSDEVDLGELISKTVDFIKGLWLGLMRFLARIRRVPIENRMLFSLVIIGSTAVAFGYGSFLKKKFYESTMILSSNYLNKRIVDNTVEKLNLLAREQDKTGLSRVLNIPDSLAQNILLFEAKPFVSENDIIELEVLKEQLKNAQAEEGNKKVIDQVIARIEIENRYAYEITVRAFSPKSIARLEQALVSYFRDNEYLKKRIEINRKNLLAKKAKLEADSRKLDSLKTIIYANYKTMAEQGRQGSNNVILSDKSVTNPVEIYSQDLDIYNELQYIERQLYVEPDFELVDGFTEFSEPSSAGLLYIVAQAILIAIGISYLIVALREFNKYLANLS